MRRVAHFCMPVIDKGLRCAHNHTVNFALVREVLRRARASVGMTLDDAARHSGLNRATIHSIENIKREPALKPELETIERLAVAYGLTLSSFFAQLEGGVVGGADSTLRRTDDTADRRALRADLLHDIGNAIIASAEDVVHEAATAHRRTARRGAKTRRSGR